MEAGSFGGGISLDHDYIYNCFDCVEYSNNITDNYINNNAQADGAHYEPIYQDTDVPDTDHLVVTGNTILNPFPQTAIVFMGQNNGCRTVALQSARRR